MTAFSARRSTVFYASAVAQGALGHQRWLTTLSATHLPPPIAASQRTLDERRRDRFDS